MRQGGPASMSYQSASSPVSRCTALSIVANGRPVAFGVVDVAAVGAQL